MPSAGVIAGCFFFPIQCILRLLFYYDQACCRREKPYPANTAPAWPQGLQQQLLEHTSAGTATAPETRTSANASTGFFGLLGERLISASSRVSYPLLAFIRTSARNRQGYTPLTMKRKLEGLHRAACIQAGRLSLPIPSPLQSRGKTSTGQRKVFKISTSLGPD